MISYVRMDSSYCFYLEKDYDMMILIWFHADKSERVF